MHKIENSLLKLMTENFPYCNNLTLYFNNLTLV